MSRPFAITTFFDAARRGSPLLFWYSLAMAFGTVVCLLLPFVDLRQIGGASVWEKPGKFFLSFVVQFITIAWAISLFPKPARGVKTASWIMFAAALFELVYIIYRASRGEASHFNTGTLVAGVMYALMGVGALLLTATSAFIGFRLFQNRDDNIMRHATSIGLMLGAVLGTIGGGHLSSQPSHWIGGDMTDATGLLFFNWSTSGGDLRVSHFIGLHAMQIVPFAGLSGRKSVVYAAALAVTLAMTGTFAMAVMGIPLFRA
jgi:hypothetical protein